MLYRATWRDWLMQGEDGALNGSGFFVEGSCRRLNVRWCLDETTIRAPLGGMRASKLRSRQPRSSEQGHSNNLNGKHDDTSLSVPVGQYHSKRGGIHGQTTAFRLHRTESQGMVSPNRSPACVCWGRACLSCVCCSLAALRNHFFVLVIAQSP